MNKYIKFDIESAIVQMKAAIMNALHDIDSGEEKEINLGPYLSELLFYNCLIESNWTKNLSVKFQNSAEKEWKTYSGKCVLITGSYGQDYKIKLIE